MLTFFLNCWLHTYNVVIYAINYKRWHRLRNKSLKVKTKRVTQAESRYFFGFQEFSCTFLTLSFQVNKTAIYPIFASCCDNLL